MLNCILGCITVLLLCSEEIGGITEVRKFIQKPQFFAHLSCACYILTCIVRILEKRFNMHAWQMQEAKARLSEVVKCAESEGPQNITLHGQSVAVLVSRAMFERLSGNEHSLVDFMRRSPLYGSEDIFLDRNASVTREVSL